MDRPEKIANTLKLKTTDELITIWKNNDRAEYEPDTFDIIREILNERIESIPPQNAPIEEKPENEGIVELLSRIILWIARIIGLLASGFFLAIFFGDFLQSLKSSPMINSDGLTVFLCFTPVVIGFAVTWLSKLWGGIVMVLGGFFSGIGHQYIISSTFDWGVALYYIIPFSSAGLLFIIYSIMAFKKREV